MSKLKRIEVKVKTGNAFGADGPYYNGVVMLGVGNRDFRLAKEDAFERNHRDEFILDEDPSQ
jgi:hypothetical protein